MVNLEDVSNQIRFSEKSSTCKNSTVLKSIDDLPTDYIDNKDIVHSAVEMEFRIPGDVKIQVDNFIDEEVPLFAECVSHESEIIEQRCSSVQDHSLAPTERLTEALLKVSEIEDYSVMPNKESTGIELSSYLYIESWCYFTLSYQVCISKRFLVPSIVDIRPLEIMHLSVYISVLAFAHFLNNIHRLDRDKAGFVVSNWFVGPK